MVGLLRDWVNSSSISNAHEATLSDGSRTAQWRKATSCLAGSSSAAGEWLVSAYPIPRKASSQARSSDYPLSFVARAHKNFQQAHAARGDSEFASAAFAIILCQPLASALRSDQVGRKTRADERGGNCDAEENAGGRCGNIWGRRSRREGEY
jgi:hypothetical protein